MKISAHLSEHLLDEAFFLDDTGEAADLVGESVKFVDREARRIARVSYTIVRSRCR